MKVVVRERSTTEIDERTYRTLESAPEFWTLVEGGVFALIRGKGKRFGLRAGAFVGQFSIKNDFHVQVTEKIPGAVAGLIRCSSPDDLKVLFSPSLHGDSETLLSEFARQLIHAVGRYISHGRVKAYLPLTSELATPKGRINMRASVERLARGRKGRLVCTRSVLSPDLPENQLIGLGLAIAESYLSGEMAHSETVALCRMYAPLFEDVQWRWVARQPESERQRLFDAALSRVHRDTDLYVALAYARALVMHLGAWASDDESVLTPHSYFLNLESLFENAVRQELRNLVGVDRVQRGVERGTPMFVALADRYIVDPDIVIDGSELIVCDCKYKDIAMYPDHADVYQLTAHAQALDSRKSALIVPGESQSLRKLGTTAANLTVFVSQVRPQELQLDLASLVEEMCIIESPCHLVAA